MSISLTLAVFLIAQVRADSALGAFALEEAMELEDADLNLRKQREAVLAARRRMAGIDRMHDKGTLTDAQYKSETSNMRYQVAVENELAAARDLSAYRRAVLHGDLKDDRAKAIDLIRILLDKHEAAARIEFDYQTGNFAFKDNLFQKKLIRGSERDEVERSYLQAQARLLLIRLRRARFNVETADRSQKDGRLVVDLRIEYLRAMIRYDELLVADAKSQLDVARTRFRVNLIGQTELSAFERVLDAAEITLATERKELEALHPPDLPKPKDDKQKTLNP